MRRPGIETRADVPAIPGVVDLALVGTGGSGLVYRGRQEALSRVVAVKVLATPPATPGSLSRWQRELDAMGRLSNHPNIVAVYDSGLTADGRPYLVMPFAPDGSLGDLVRSSGPLAPEEAIRIGVKIAHALTAAHAAGVLHRDVKPDNVLLSPYEPQLADFGIARLVDATTTAATAIGMIHATINYAAPEVLAGEAASEASDVYSLAATLYTALGGDVPFPHAADANAVAVAHQIIHNPVPPLDPSVPRQVAQVIAHGMAKAPGDRPSSAAAFAAELENALVSGTGDTDEVLTAPVDEVEPTTRYAATVRADAIPTIAERSDERRPIARRAAPVSPPRRDRPRAVLLLVPLVVLVAGVLYLARSSGDKPRVTSPTVVATTVAPSAATSKTPTTARRVQAAPSSSVAEAARQYFTRLSQGDYAGAYSMLSSGFRAAQSQASFERFWRSASPVSITGPVTANGLTATVPVRMGGRPNTYVLTFARGSGNTLSIDGPRPR